MTLALADDDRNSGNMDDAHKARVGRGPLKPSPRCDDLPPPPEAGVFSAWIVAIVEPQGEIRAQKWLWHRNRVQAWVPTIPQLRTNGGIRRKKRIDQVPLIRGYALIPAMYFESAAIMRAPGVHRFMDVDGVLVVIPDGRMEKLRDYVKMLNDPNYGKDDGRYKFVVGEAVRYANALLQDIVAEVVSVDRANRIVLRTESGARIVTSPGKIEPLPKSEVRGPLVGQASRSRQVRK